MNTKINRWIYGLSFAFAALYVVVLGQYTIYEIGSDVTSSGYMLIDLISIFLGIAIFTHLFVRKCDRKVRGLFSAFYGIFFGYATDIYGIPVVTSYLEEVGGIYYYSGGDIIVFYIVATIAGILFYNMSGKSSVALVDKYGNETNPHMETNMITLLALYYLLGSFASS